MQDYVLDDSVTYAEITPCPGGDLNFTPAWPLRREDCVPVSRRVTRVYWKKEGGDEETARVVGSTIERSSQTGERYGSLISHGGAHARTPRIANARYEITPFGIECLRIDALRSGRERRAG